MNKIVLFKGILQLVFDLYFQDCLRSNPWGEPRRATSTELKRRVSWTIYLLYYLVHNESPYLFNIPSSLRINSAHVNSVLSNFVFPYKSLHHYFWVDLRPVGQFFSPRLRSVGQFFRRVYVQQDNFPKKIVLLDIIKCISYKLLN